MKEACGDCHLKTILATGELGCLENVYKASMVCMMAGLSLYYSKYVIKHFIFYFNSMGSKCG